MGLHRRGTGRDTRGLAGADRKNGPDVSNRKNPPQLRAKKRERRCLDVQSRGSTGGGGGLSASVPLPRLPLTKGEALDGDITIAEVLAAIQQLPAGKAPGADGFSAEFYKSFGSLLAPVLVRLYNELGPAVHLPHSKQLGLLW
ncbi:hypothetical protein NDU88_004903 [Pleurodeles waltl]|uniref:Uncharacterized protein n=1 Tax=Pleurodeles waltl TaxID=8319 RepID=A0AAV7TU43_PLEWA|nr:hypothetical protein NDU88_004903 [Pleurodeles waltl]